MIPRPIETIIFAGIMLLIGVAAAGILWVSASEWSIWLWLKQSGILVQGKVAGRGSHPQGRGWRYYVIYTFRPIHSKGYGTSFQREQQVGRKYLDKIHGDMPITIAYVADNPNISRLAGEYVDNSLRNTVTVVSVIIMLLFPPIALLWPIFFIAARFVPHTWLRR